MENYNDTIFALSTPPGISGVAVLRISGINATEVIHKMIGHTIEPRLASLVRLVDPTSHTVIDKSIALYFPQPNSFTGEDVVELHTHGGRAVINAALSALAAMPGFRPAEAGEFTRRAFYNDKLDLTEAEAISDLIHATTESQRKQAMRQMSGALSDLYHGWSRDLKHALAQMEAYLDFPDEEIPNDVYARLCDSVQAVQSAIQRHLADRNRGELLRAGLYAAIIGPPNAGKSSLLNALAKRDIAIVSHIAGTTRDVIEISLDINGYPMTLADTAGIRDTADSIEIEGIKRTRRAADAADIKIMVLDVLDQKSFYSSEVKNLIDQNTIVVWNKSDLAPDTQDLPPLPQAQATIMLSTKTGYNLAPFLELLGGVCAARMGVGDDPQITRIRHRAAVIEAEAAITRFVVSGQNTSAHKTHPELQAEDLRKAVYALARITGKVDVEDILDIVFAEFCIGK